MNLNRFCLAVILIVLLRVFVAVVPDTNFAEKLFVVGAASFGMWLAYRGLWHDPKGDSTPFNEGSTPLEKGGEDA